ncbi:MAG: chorismate mutase [Erysipelotrichaceae bacterium]|nr:chorismate mutase [Erysipelotrichaceae bacterium]
MNIKELRSEIDLIDKELKTLFIKRMSVVSRVIEYKKLHDMNVYDPKREQEMFEGLSSDLKEPLKTYYLAFLKNYVNISKDYQNHEKNNH